MSTNKKIEVVLVNNNEIQSEFIASLLNENNYVVEKFFDEDKCYDFLIKKEDLTSIVVVGYMLKSGNGLSLIKSLKDKDKDFAFVFLSSDNTIERVVEAMQVGVVDFVSKTYQLVENFETVILRAYNNQLTKLRHKELEDAIAQKNIELARLSIVASETINIVYIYSKTFELEWVNRSFVELYGYSKDEFIEKFGIHLYEHSANDKINQIIEDCIVNRRAVTYTNQITSKVGEELWLQTTINPVIIESGKIDQFVVIETDITDIKRAERKIIQQQRKIEESLNYAERTQKSILPQDEQIQKFFQNYFIFFMPSEKVSGDLPFFHLKHDYIFIASIDCTGHGVPGAFLTFVVYSNLVNIIDIGFTSPTEILHLLNKKLNDMMHRSQEIKITSFDDLEIGLCSIEPKLNKLLYAGVGHKLLMIHNKELFVYKVESKSMLIACLRQNKPINISDNEIIYTKGDRIFIGSDGFQDLLNGRNLKQRFSSKRVSEFVQNQADKTMAEMYQNVALEIDQWRGEAAPVDDILFMGFEF